MVAFFFLDKISPTETNSSQSFEGAAGIFNDDSNLNFHSHVLRNLLAL